METLAQENERLRTQIQELQTQLSEPPLTPLEKAQMKAVLEKLEKVSEGAKALLRRMLTHGKVTQHSIHDFTFGQPVAVTEKYLAELSNQLLVETEMDAMSYRIWSVNSHLRTALERCLLASD